MVPLTMPITRVMRSPTSDSRSGRMIGMPPATAASKRRSTPAASAAWNSSAPALGQELLVAGDDRLAGLERAEDQLAGRLDAADELDDDVDVGIVDDRPRVGGEDARAAGRWRAAWCRSRTATRVTSRRRPVRASMSSALRRRSARPAARRRCRSPSTPTRTGTGPRFVAHGRHRRGRPSRDPPTSSSVGEAGADRQCHALLRSSSMAPSSG